MGKGFSLVEMLVATALLMVVLAAVFALMPFGGNNWDKGAAMAEAQQHGRIAMEEICHELRYAVRVDIHSTGNSLVYYKQSGGSQKRYRLYTAGRQLLLDLPEGTSVPLAASVESLRVTPAGLPPTGGLITITLVTAEQGSAVTYRTGVVVRNLAGDGL